MFKQLKNIDSAFRHIRLFSILFLLFVSLFSGYVIYQYSLVVKRGQQRVYVMVNSRLMDAFAIDRSDSLSAEIKDHVRLFHYYFYSLEPDEEMNKRHLISALYLADNSARQEYENLLESGYYSNIISGNITQQVPDYDSIQINLNTSPYYFKYFGKLKIIRTTSIITRSLIAEGYIRVLNAVSAKNIHGFLIENWKVIENKDLTIDKR